MAPSHSSLAPSSLASEPLSPLPQLSGATSQPPLPPLPQLSVATCPHPISSVQPHSPAPSPVWSYPPGHTLSALCSHQAPTYQVYLASCSTSSVHTPASASQTAGRVRYSSDPASCSCLLCQHTCLVIFHKL